MNHTATAQRPDPDPELGQFVERAYAELIRFVRSKAPEQDAQEIVQDSLTALVEKHGCVEIQDFRAYTFQIVRNKLKQYYDKRRRGGLVSAILDDMDDLIPMSLLSTRLTIRVARDNDLQVAMQKLSRRHFEVFELRYIHELSIDQLIKITERSRATINRDLEAARKQLAGVLGGADSDDAVKDVLRAYVKG
jgi:RNA polymerase sigma factor (sigma-70 family)